MYRRISSRKTALLLQGEMNAHERYQNNHSMGCNPTFYTAYLSYHYEASISVLIDRYIFIHDIRASVTVCMPTTAISLSNCTAVF